MCTPAVRLLGFGRQPRTIEVPATSTRRTHHSNLRKMESEPTTEDVATITSLPPELRRMIFAYLSLGELYKIRATSQIIGRCASATLIDRVHVLLAIEGNFYPFHKFLKEIQRTDDENGPLQPRSVGKLLAKAKVPIHSIAVLSVARFHALAPGFSLREAGIIYKSMGATVKDVALALYGFGYWSDEFADLGPGEEQAPDDSLEMLERRLIQSIVQFLSSFEWGVSEVFECLSFLKDLGLRCRWTVAFDYFRWVRFEPEAGQKFINADTFVTDIWPRAISMARSAQKGVTGQSNDVKMCEELLDLLLMACDSRWTQAERARLFSPVSGLSTRELAEIFVASRPCITLHNGNLRGNGPLLLRAYVTDDPSSTEQNLTLPTATWDESETFFRVLAGDERSLAIAIGRFCFVQDRWPSYMDPSAPDFLELRDFTRDEEAIHALLRALLEPVIPVNLDAEKGQQLSRRFHGAWQKFYAANKLSPHLSTWLAVANRVADRHSRMLQRARTKGRSFFDILLSLLQQEAQV